MKHLNLIVAMAIMIFITSSCNFTPTPARNANIVTADSLPAQPADTILKNPADTAEGPATAFIVAADAGARMEIELGRLAQQDAQRSRVKSYGTMMVREHTASLKLISTLAGRSNIEIPPRLPEAIQNDINEMKRSTVSAFDRNYMEMMTNRHKAIIVMFTQAAENLKDSTLRNFAARSLPMLKLHLDSAKAIRKSID